MFTQINLNLVFTQCSSICFDEKCIIFNLKFRKMYYDFNRPGTFTIKIWLTFVEANIRKILCGYIESFQRS